eukprot:6470130-Amphidinium_carterae.1
MSDAQDESAPISAAPQSTTVALLDAVKIGDADAALAALERGAEVQSSDENGSKALHWAAFNGLDTVVNQLVNMSAEVDAKQEDGRQPLHMAADSGQFETVKTLLALNASVDAREDDGGQPIHWSALGGH